MTCAALVVGAAVFPFAGATHAGQAETPPVQSAHVFREVVRETTRDLAEAVDSFFSDAEYEEERNETSLSLKFGAGYMTKDDWKFRMQPRLRLRLPHTERLLLVEIVGERSSDADSEPFFLSDGLAEDDQDVGGLELRLRMFDELGDVRVTPEVGVRFSDFTPHLFAGARASRDWRLTENWLLFASQRARVHTDRGVETNTVVRASRPTHIFRDDLLRASFGFDWRADEPGVKYTPGLSLFAPIDEQSAIAFETSVRFETDPEHQVDLAAATVRYRRKVIYDWWTAEIAPRIEFAEEHDYDASYGARLRLDLDF